MRRLSNVLIALSSAVAPSSVLAAQGFELIYKEQEEGVDPYLTRMTVSEYHLRIDDLTDASGYIVFDAKARKIYSVSHQDRAILVISENSFKRPVISDKLVTQDKTLDDAPEVAGKKVHDYRVELSTNDGKQLCTSIQYVPGLLPEVGNMLHAYQQLVSGNAVKTLSNTPVEMQTPCILSDQVYNQGEYYTRGLPILEWHSNGRQRYLESYKPVQIDARLFELPKHYRQLNNE